MAIRNDTKRYKLFWHRVRIEYNKVPNNCITYSPLPVQKKTNFEKGVYKEYWEHFGRTFKKAKLEF